MTFMQDIFEELNRVEHTTTDDFSIRYLGQSRSYFSSLSARDIDASNTVLMKLMNSLVEHGQDKLAKKVAKELASRASNTSFCTKATKTILANAVALHRKKAATNDSAILFC
jgi:hypothetical protein